MIMNQKRFAIILLILVLLLSTFVQAGFVSWLKGIFVSSSLTGYAIAGDACQTNEECGDSMICGNNKCQLLIWENHAEIEAKLDQIIEALRRLREGRGVVCNPQTNEPCGGNRFCALEERVCVEKLSENAPCQNNRWCLSGSCVNDFCIGSNVASPLPEREDDGETGEGKSGRGGTCVSDRNCEGELVCERNICMTEENAAGERTGEGFGAGAALLGTFEFECRAKEPKCNAGLACKDYLCLKNGGQSCSIDVECVSGSCEESTCTAVHAEETPPVLYNNDRYKSGYVCGSDSRFKNIMFISEIGKTIRQEIRGSKAKLYLIDTADELIEGPELENTGRNAAGLFTWSGDGCTVNVKGTPNNLDWIGFDLSCPRGQSTYTGGTLEFDYCEVCENTPDTNNYCFRLVA